MKEERGKVVLSSARYQVHYRLKEEWRRVGGTRYEVSSLGRVRSLDLYKEVRYSDQSPRWKLYRGRLMRTTVGSSGYRGCLLSGKYTRTHLLVATAFHGQRPDNLVCDHINGNKLDNRACNLRWVTSADNNYPSYLATSMGCVLYKDGEPLYARSMGAAARYLGVSSAAIHQLVSKQTLTIKGYACS